MSVFFIPLFCCERCLKHGKSSINALIDEKINEICAPKSLTYYYSESGRPATWRGFTWLLDPARNNIVSPCMEVISSPFTFSLSDFVKENNLFWWQFVTALCTPASLPCKQRSGLSKQHCLLNLITCCIIVFIHRLPFIRGKWYWFLFYGDDPKFSFKIRVFK